MNYLAAFLIALTLIPVAQAEEEDEEIIGAPVIYPEQEEAVNYFIGVAQFIPTNKVGDWMVGNRMFFIDEHARWEQTRYPVREQHCVILTFEDGRVEEIAGLGPRTYKACATE